MLWRLRHPWLQVLSVDDVLALRTLRSVAAEPVARPLPLVAVVALAALTARGAALLPLLMPTPLAT